MKRLTLCGILLVILTSQSVASQDARNERIRFPEGATSASIAGSIVGYESVNYVVDGRAGQSMAVALTSDNSGSYFNIFAPNKVPGNDYAMFISSTKGNHFDGVLPADGDYTIQVYIIRSAARHGRTANFTLEVAIVPIGQEGGT